MWVEPKESRLKRGGLQFDSLNGDVIVPAATSPQR